MKKKKLKQALALAELMGDRPEIHALIEAAATSPPARVQRLAKKLKDADVGPVLKEEQAGVDLRGILVRARLALDIERKRVALLKNEVRELREAVRLQRV